MSQAGLDDVLRNSHTTEGLLSRLIAVPLSIYLLELARTLPSIVTSVNSKFFLLSTQMFLYLLMSKAIVILQFSENFYIW